MNLKQVFVSGASVVLTASVLSPLLQPKTKADDSFGRLIRAFQMYAEDANDLLPIAFPKKDLGGGSTQWGWNRLVLAPNGWTRSSTPDQNQSEIGVWVNTIRPYLESDADLELPGAEVIQEQRYAGDYLNPLKPPIKVGWTFNGLLNSYPIHAIADPGKLSIIWTGYGKANVLGFGISNPGMLCMTPHNNPCVFEGKQEFSMNRSTFFMTRRTIQIEDDKAYFLTASGRLWKKSVGNVNAGEFTDYRKDPFGSYDIDKRPVTAWNDQFGFPMFFRPDATFENVDP